MDTIIKIFKTSQNQTRFVVCGMLNKNKNMSWRILKGLARDHLEGK